MQRPRSMIGRILPYSTRCQSRSCVDIRDSRGVSSNLSHAAAKLCALNILAQVKAAVGDLDKVVRVVKVTGFVNSTPDFRDQPKVVNGASDFLVAALGDRGRHARAAVGVAALPFGVAVEVEAIVEVAP